MPKHYGHKAMDDDGKFHPSDILPGLETVDKQGGSQGKDASTPRGSASPPRGVKQAKGTETLQGTKVTKKRGQAAKAPGSGSKHYPSEVRKHDGLKAPHAGKQPK